MEERVDINEVLDTLEEAIREEYDASVDVADRINEQVDGSEWVIYYDKAAQLLDSAEDDEVEAAFEADRDNGGRGGLAADTFAQLRCRMAYYLLEARLMDRVRDLL